MESSFGSVKKICIVYHTLDTHFAQCDSEKKGIIILCKSLRFIAIRQPWFVSISFLNPKCWLEWGRMERKTRKWTFEQQKCGTEKPSMIENSRMWNSTNRDGNKISNQRRSERWKWNKIKENEEKRKIATDFFFSKKLWKRLIQGKWWKRHKHIKLPKIAK